MTGDWNTRYKKRYKKRYKESLKETAERERKMPNQFRGAITTSSRRRKTKIALPKINALGG